MGSLVKPGIYENVPFAEYLGIDAVNHSRIKHFTRSAMHAREYILHPPAATPALEFGEAAHTAILEPERFLTDYIVGIKVDRRTKVGKAAWADFEAEAGTRTLLNEEDCTRLMGMREAVMANDTCRELLEPLAEKTDKTELTFIWTDGPTGLLCKGRADRLTRHGDWSVIVDLKSTKDASAASFNRAVVNYGYHTQAAFYEEGLYTLAPVNRRFLIIAVEHTRPHGVAVYDLESYAETGKVLMRRYLTAYARAVERDEWPGYPGGIQHLCIPPWAVETEGDS